MLPKHRSRCLLVVGLDGSGKTSLLACLPELKEEYAAAAHVLGLDNVTTLPTSGGMQKVELTVVKRKADRKLFRRRVIVHWDIMDMSGQGKHRNLWISVLPMAHAIAFVVDVTDHRRTASVRRELHCLAKMSSVVTRQLPVLIFANKMDIASQVDGSLTLEELKVALGLEQLPTSWRLLPARYDSDDTVKEGLEWLTSQVA